MGRNVYTKHSDIECNDTSLLKAGKPAIITQRRIWKVIITLNTIRDDEDACDD